MPPSFVAVILIPYLKWLAAAAILITSLLMVGASAAATNKKRSYDLGKPNSWALWPHADKTAIGRVTGSRQPIWTGAPHTRRASDGLVHRAMDRQLVCWPIVKVAGLQSGNNH